MASSVFKYIFGKFTLLGDINTQSAYAKPHSNPTPKERQNKISSDSNKIITLTNEDMIKRIFEPTDFKINIKRGEYVITTIEEEKCIVMTFRINFPNISLHNLYKCGLNTGTKLLQKIDALAKITPGIKTISLSDESKITVCDDIEISLSYINILSSGKSWYNSHGYFSQTYDKEQQNNLKYLDYSIYDFLKNCIGPGLKKYTETMNDIFNEPDDNLYPKQIAEVKLYRENKEDAKQNYKTRIESYYSLLYDNFHEYFDKDFLTIKVKEFFIKVKELLLNKDCVNKEKWILIQNVIELSEVVLIYNNNYLIKTLSADEGKGTKIKKQKQKFTLKKIYSKKNKTK